MLIWRNHCDAGDYNDIYFVFIWIHPMIKPAEAFKNWVGGFTDFNVTIGFAANGSIPVTSAAKIS